MLDYLPFFKCVIIFFILSHCQDEMAKEHPSQWTSTVELREGNDKVLIFHVFIEHCISMESSAMVETQN